MKTQYYTIEYLKALHPTLEYADGNVFVGEEIIQEDVDWLIEDYYNGLEVYKGHSSKNPELDYPEIVDGKEYIELEFDGDYSAAFDQI